MKVVVGDNMKVYCGIVTYNPKIDVLKENIKSVYDQVNKVIIVDNASSNLKMIIDEIVQHFDVILISNKENLGIASALNQIVSVAIKDEIDWVLTLDQDSLVPENYLISFTEYMSDNVGILCPRIFDIERNVEDLPSKEASLVVEVLKCITSGSILNVDAWKTVKGFDEKLFIDGVDFDYCFRIRQAGYRILKNQKITIQHSIGERRVIKIGKIKKIISSHSGFRLYYICRNKVYCDYKIRKYISLRSLFSIVKILCNIILWEDNKSDKLKCSIKGIRDSFELIKNYRADCEVY